MFRVTILKIISATLLIFARPSFLVEAKIDLKFDYSTVDSILGENVVLNIFRDDDLLQQVVLDGVKRFDDLKKNEINADNFVLTRTADENDFKIEYSQREADLQIITISRVLPREMIMNDCFNMNPTELNWFGGPQQKYQYWPIQKLQFSNYSYITKEADNCAITERYWLASNGVFLFVDPNTPLFINQNHPADYLCFEAKQALPYDRSEEKFLFRYHIGIAADAKIAHRMAVKYILGKPTNIPDERMVRHPIWSTWARYKRDIDENVVMAFANEILDNKFNNSQYEIDDDWEVCYGALTFRESKFPNIKQLTDTLKSKGFRVTLWIHPFINKGCEPWYSEAKSKGYFVMNHQNNTDTQWWNSQTGESAYIDFTKLEAATWFSDRLKKLQDSAGIDSYKFDAGESSWTPGDPILNGPKNRHPSLITTDYIRTVAKFGPLVEVRSGQGTQDLPIFVRMIDKDSRWDWNNGLPTLITTLLQMNMAGYPFVLPDMIGGNGYEGAPEKEMFIRWLAANVFMPSLQFSYVPWDYDSETISIAQKFAELHDQYTDEIMGRLKLAVEIGDPVNLPLWWADPEDKTAQAVYDQYMLGDNIIAAPVIEKGKTVRNIYLPKGNWKDGNLNTVHTGPKTITDYPAPLDVIPYFVRQN